MVASAFGDEQQLTLGGGELRDEMVAAMQKVEDEERALREQEEAEAATAKAADASPSAVEAVDADTKLAKLDSLLEKAGLYSSFLFSNMASAATVEVEAEDAPAAGKKRARKSKASGGSKKQKKGEGAAKLREVQSDAALQQRSSFAQPKLLSGGTLRDYQLEGIRWLCNLFENGLNGILADEMGLGKTIQVIGLIAHLKSLGVRGPFLITAPLSTLMNWSNEFRKWAPSIPAIVYHGTRAARRAMRSNELHKSRRHDADFPVIITSYEVILQDAKSFSSMGFVWKYIVIDEGHRLKNMNCKLVKELKRARSENRLLLTGTPLQNNLTELWSLLNFILPDVFDDLELFESWFSFTPDAGTDANNTNDMLSGTKKAEVVSKLHEILRPFLLRRLKTDVVEEMPSKTEIFVYCPMVPLQREYYAMILNRTLASAMEAKYGKFQAAAQFKTNSLRNRAMQLRKCCNHPYLFDEPTDANGEVVTNEDLVNASGKLLVLDRMLADLKRKGHKVLIFSQMTRVLDVLQDYLTLRRYSFCRLDGSTDLDTRQQQVDDFNETKARSDAAMNDRDSVFCFLLSTRAGGLGINLISADTVIFFDSDWNPQQDNQAQDRCHRIGQTQEIVVYRLVTENSFENRMIRRAIEKRKLERVVIQRGQFKQQVDPATSASVKAVTNAELEELLRDDVLIRDGVESGGIGDDELAHILNRELVVRSFASKSTEEGGAKAKEDGSIVLPAKGKGYEVVDNSPSSVMESFA